MKLKQIYFSNLESLKSFIHHQKKGFILVSYESLETYKGMVLGITLLFDTSKNDYQLDLQWISFGLDLFGENLLENYVYQFDSLEILLNYLALTYKIKVEHIPIQYKIDEHNFPNPIKNSTEKPEFEKAWNQFQDDFKNGIFLDSSLQLVYSS